MSLIQNPASHNCALNIKYLLLSLTITPLLAKANNTLIHVMHDLEWLTALFRTVTLKSSWKSINTAGLLHWYIVYNERSNSSKRYHHANISTLLSKDYFKSSCPFLWILLIHERTTGLNGHVMVRSSERIHSGSPPQAELWYWDQYKKTSVPHSHYSHGVNI